MDFTYFVEKIRKISGRFTLRFGPQKPKIFDPLARFKALRAAQERAKPAPDAPWKIEVSAKAVTSGRVALRILEHGEGPEIEIAWPYSVRASNRLYHLFTACFGMKTAVMDSAGQLYTAAGGGRRRPNHSMNIQWIFNEYPMNIQ